LTVCRDLPYREVWAVDFEFTAHTGGRPIPLCCVARELRRGRLARTWLADGAPARPPYDTGPDTLFVAYYASAELGCQLALGWPTPARVLDLFAEFRCRTSGLPVPCGNGLLGALAYFGLDGLDAAEKEDMRRLAMRGGPYTAGEREALLDYCQSDVDALARLLPAMLPQIDLPRALLRGRYMTAAARMEWNGVPLDAEALARLRDGWDGIKGRLIAAVDADYGVFVPAGRRSLNPGSTLGAAILHEAEAWGIDPYRLADAVDAVWEEERQASAETFAARRAARKATGLTARRIGRWEDAGHDYSEWPGLDATARTLAGRHPALGIGPGYTAEGGPDDTDYAGRLWEVLRERTETARPKHHPNVLRRAAELVASCPAGEADPCGPMRFSAERWAGYLAREGIPWPRLESGALALDDDTFREMARAYPVEVGPVRELRHTLGQLRLHELAVGSDGRNRCLLSAFGSKTGRNQPSNSRFVFGPSTWLRGLIRPGPGRAVAYCDWSAQEYGIAAALSVDKAMQADYLCGDPYLAFAKRAGAVPPDATKQTHGKERELYKVCCGLGAMYGAGERSLALRLGIPPAHARELLRLHRQSYPDFWRWSDAVQDFAMLHGYLETAFGWRVRVGPDANPRSLRNFPMQANGAEMMRLACCLATERGIAVCCPVHDALLVEGPADCIADVAAETQRVMREASELVLPGFPLRTEAKVVRYPDRYLDERGRRMWETVSGLLEAGTPAAGDTLAGGTPATGDTLPLSPVTPPSSLMSSYIGISS
jgi:hypothetical protein